MNVKERFLKYISVDTTSDPSSETFPSTKSQLAFAADLEAEMKEMGLAEVSLDQYGYVFGTIPPPFPTIRKNSGLYRPHGYLQRSLRRQYFSASY